MDKKRLKIALTVLDAVKNRFSEAKEFIDNTLTEECEEKGNCRWGNESFTNLNSKKLVWINIFCF